MCYLAWSPFRDETSLAHQSLSIRNYEYDRKYKPVNMGLPLAEADFRLIGNLKQRHSRIVLQITSSEYENGFDLNSFHRGIQQLYCFYNMRSI